MVCEEDSNFTKSILGISLTGIAAFGAQYCLQPIIKDVAAYYGRGADGAGLIMGASLLGMAAMLLVLVYISDRLPIKKCILGSLCFALACTFSVWFIEDLYVFIVNRFLQGAVLAMIPVLTITYARLHSTPEKAGFAVSMYICGMTLGGLSGRLAMGILADYFPWKTALMLLGAIYAVIVALEFWLLQPDKPRTVAGKTQDSHFDFFSYQGLKLLAVCLFGFSFSDCFFIVFNFIPYIFSAPPYNFSHTLISMIFLIQIFGSFSSFVSGRLHARFGAYKLAYAGLSLIGIGALSTLLDGVAPKCAGLIIINLGFFATQSMGSVMSSGISEAHKSSCTAAYMFTYYTGASVITSIGGYLYRAFGWNALIAVEIAEISFAALFLTWFIWLNKHEKK